MAVGGTGVVAMAGERPAFLREIFLRRVALSRGDKRKAHHHRLRRAFSGLAVLSSARKYVVHFLYATHNRSRSQFITIVSSPSRQTYCYRGDKVRSFAGRFNSPIVSLRYMLLGAIRQRARLGSLHFFKCH